MNISYEEMIENGLLILEGLKLAESLKDGDHFYEFDYGFGSEFKVVGSVDNTEETISWVAENVKTGVEVEFFVSKTSPHYAPKIYNYIAYGGVEWV